MNNGLNANIKSMTQAEKTLLRYQYVMANTSKVQGDFARTANTWHNQIVILKQQFQQLATVIGSALIQALKPFVMRMNSALSGLIKFAQNVVNALGKIFGWEMEVNTKGLQLDDEDLDYDADALDNVANSADDVASSSDKAAKATKKLNEQLQGFDKLNVLRTTEKTPSTSTSKNKNDKNGSGATSGNGLVSGGDVSSALKKTKSKFESEIDDLYGLGQHIADKIKKALKDIKWKDVYSAAEKWGEGLANFLNGIVDDKDLFSEIGTTVANGINTALTFLDSFGKTFHWDNFGASLAASLTSFLKNIKWKKALSAAKNWGSGIGTAIASFIKENDFKEVGKAIAMAIKTVLTFWLSLGSEIPWKDLGQKLADTINSAIKNFPAKDFADTIDVWVQGIFDLLVAALSNIHWDELAGKIAEFISNLDFKTIAIVIGALTLLKAASFVLTIGSALLSAITSQFIAQLAAKLMLKMGGSTLLSGAIGKGLGDAAGKAAKGEYLGTAGASLGQTLFGGFMVGGGIYMAVKSFLSMWDKGWSLAGEIFKDVGIAVAAAGAVILGVLTGPVAIAVAGAAIGLSSLAIAIKDNWGDIKKEIKEKADAMSESWNQLKTGAANLGTDLGKEWESMKTDFGTMVENVKTSAQEGWNNLTTTASGAWKTLTTGASDGAKKIGDKWEEMKTNAGTLATSLGNKWETMKTGFGNLKDNIVKHAGTISKDSGIKFEELRTTVGDKVETLKTNAEKKFEDLKKNLPQKIRDLSTQFGNPFKTITTVFERGFGNAGTKALNKIIEMKNNVIKKINSLIKEVGKVLPMALGKLFKFELPTFQFETKTLQIANLKITYPSRVVASWHKKAYQNPMMFTQPTLMPTMSGLKGFGDGTGGEIVYGHRNLMRDIEDASGNSDMTAIGNRQLANDHRIIQLLTIIAEKEFGISQDQVFRAVRNGASDYTMRTGRGAFEF